MVVAGKYWIRIRANPSFDSDVSIAEITVNDRNSNALIVMGGSNPTTGLQPAMVPWDDITNDGWENRADTPGDPWYQYGVDVGNFWGSDVGDLTVSVGFCTGGGVLNTAVDDKNNQFYTFFRSDPGSPCSGTEMSAYAFTIGNNKDVLDINNWTNTGFPLRGGDPLGLNSVQSSMSFDGKNIWMFINPDDNDTSTQSAYFMRCTPYLAGDPKICDSGGDWAGGYQKAVMENDWWYDYGTNDYYDGPEAVKVYATSVDSDTTALDYFWGGQGNGHLLYDRIYTDLEDKKVIGAASGDDGWHRDCDSGQMIRI